MISDVELRRPHFESMQAQAIEAVEDVEAAKTARQLALKPVLNALEKASAIGLDCNGILRYDDKQLKCSNPIVLCGRAFESTSSGLTFRTAEWRHASFLRTPRMSAIAWLASRCGVVEDEVSSKDPKTYSDVLQGSLAYISVPTVIGLPYGTGDSLPHEIVHWIDRDRVRFRYAPRKMWGKERLLAMAATEKRAYGLDAGILALKGIDVEALSDHVVTSTKSSNNGDVATISQRCFDTAHELVDKNHALAAYLCTEVRTLSRLFGTDTDIPTLQEAKAFIDAEILAY